MPTEEASRTAALHCWTIARTVSAQSYAGNPSRSTTFRVPAGGGAGFARKTDSIGPWTIRCDPIGYHLPRPDRQRRPMRGVSQRGSSHTPARLADPDTSSHHTPDHLIGTMLW